MELVNYFKLLFSLIFVLSLIGVGTFILKNLDFMKKKFQNSSNRRIKILETTHIDKESKIILFMKDDYEYLVLISKKHNLIIESKNKNDI